jgi:hypothetical protein
MNDYFNIFPNTKTIAYYDTFSQFINLSSINFDEFQEARKEPYTEQSIHQLSVFRHELAHWIDHTSTLWGNNNLLQLFNSLNARATNSINDFWRIKMFSDSAKSDTYFDYFTEIYNQINGSIRDRWKFNITAGYKFQSNGYTDTKRPILFVRFKSSKDESIARVPITIASILEVIATKEEYKTKFASLGLIDDFVTKTILQKQYQDELFGLIYNSNHTLYNVVSHLTANLNNQTDIIWTLETASSIGTVVLNLPNEDINKMKPSHFGIQGVDERVGDFISSADKGFSFYNLLLNLISEKGEGNYSTEDLLSASGFEDVKTMEEKVISKMEKNISELIPGPFYNMAKSTMESGIEIFKLRGIDGRKGNMEEILLQLGVKPRIMFGDTFFDDTDFNLNSVLEKLRKKEELDYRETYLTFEAYKYKLDEFIKVCGI